MSKYNYLKENYPQFISKEQLCKICGIAKDTAWIYLHSGVIPCKDTGKKTRRYTVHIDDVITFLNKRDQGQVPSRSELKYLRPRSPKKLPEIKETATWYRQSKQYIRGVLKDVTDAVQPWEMAKIVGLSLTTVQKHILHGNIEAAVAGRGYIISKNSILEFMLSSGYQNGGGCSEKYRSIMEGLSNIENNLKQARNKKREASQACNGLGAQEQVDKIIQIYLDRIDNLPDIITVCNLEVLFDKNARYIQQMLQKCKIYSAKVNGKHMVPKKSIIAFMKSGAFLNMTQFHQHLWLRIN